MPSLSTEGGAGADVRLSWEVAGVPGLWGEVGAWEGVVNKSGVGVVVGWWIASVGDPWGRRWGVVVTVVDNGERFRLGSSSEEVSS